MSSDEGRYHSKLEERVLGRLGPRYEVLGYDFVTHPDPDDLPAFMAGWIPDAVATRGSQGIAIEVSGRHAFDGERLIAIRSRFAGQQDWRLIVVSDERDVETQLEVPTSTVARIRTASAAIADLAEHGHPPAALVMSFALLETTLRATTGERKAPARKPGTVVQALAMDGLIDRSMDAELRRLIDTRNRIAHGSLDEEVDPASVNLVLAAVETALSTAFAA